MDQVSFDSAETAAPEVSFDSGTAPTSVTPEVAQTRAAKAHFGIGEVVNKNYDQIYQDISSGKEDALRREAAVNLNYANVQQKNKAIVDLAAARGSALTLEEFNHLLDPEAPSNQPINPTSVIERGYAHNYVATLDGASRRLENTPLEGADPTAVAAYKQTGTDLLAQREYALQKAENLQGAVANDAWFNLPNPFQLVDSTADPTIAVGSRASPITSAASIATMGVVGAVANEVRLRGNTEQTSRFAGIGLGETLDAQARELLDLPFNEYTAKLDAIVDELSKSSPAAAQKFAKSVAGMSTNDKIVDNAMTAANVLLAKQGYDIGNAGLRAAGDATVSGLGRRPPPGGPRPAEGLSAPGTVDAFRDADGVYRVAPTPDAAEVQKAVKDTIQSANADEVTKATMADGVGDTQEAGVQRATDSAMKPNPIKDAVVTLPRYMRSDIEDLRGDPGSLSREEHTRLLDMREGFASDVVDTNINTSKVQRLPLAVEDGFRNIATYAKQYFPGRENTILDVNVRYDAETNTHWLDHAIGNYDATQFSSRRAAEVHAEMNGYVDPKIVSEGNPTRYYVPEAAIKRPWETGFRTHEIKIVNGEPRIYTDAGGGVMSEVQLSTTPQAGHLPIDIQGPNFKTSKGSSYAVQPDGTTIRNKSPHPEHPGDVGIKPKSTTTAYITEEQYAAIKKNKPLEGGYQKNPKVGLIPVEWMPDGKIHFGNKIVEVNADSVKIGPALDVETVKVAQQGLGFHLIVSRPIREVDSFFRNDLIGDSRAFSSSNRSVTPARAWGNAVLGAFRSPLDTQSAVEYRNELKAVYSQSKFAGLAVEHMQYIEDVAKGKVLHDEFGDPKNWVINKPYSYLGKVTGQNNQLWTALTRTLDAARKIKDPDTGLPGYFYKGQTELDNFYLLNFDRTPSFAESKAYFAYVDLYNYDLYMREIGMFKNKARLGTETHSLEYIPDRSNSKEPIKVSFEGVMGNELPRTEDAILVHNADGSQSLHSADSLSTSMSERLREGIRTGKQKVVEIYDPEAAPLNIRDSKGNLARVRYVVSDGLKTSELSSIQIGRRGGGHFEYDYDHYLKQPIVREQWVGNKRQHIYEGDATFAPVDNITMGKDLASKFNAVRLAIKDGRMKDAKALVETHSDVPWKEVRSWFFPQKNPATNEIVPPRFNLKYDFQVVPKGTTVHELNKDFADQFKIKKKTGKEIDTFVDGTRHGSLARNFQVEYTGRRDSYDLFTFKNIGNKDNPVYKYEPAEFTDPIVTLNRALNRIINSTFMDDQKISGMEHWLQENRDVLKATDSEIRAAPFAIFNEITPASFKKGDGAAGTARMTNAMNNHYKLKKFVGTPSTTDTMIHAIKQTLSDSMYSSPTVMKINKAGDVIETATGSKTLGKVIRAPAVVPEWLLDRVKSPVDFFRGVAFHSVMGLWAVPQILVQQANWSTIAALAPSHVGQASFATLMHWWSKLNRHPEVTDAMDYMAGKFGWRPGDLTEARNILDRTGFEHVGAEHALRSRTGYSVKKYVQPGVGSDIKKITLDWGQYPFLYGERNVRIGAWYTAFHEWRVANPIKNIGQIEEGIILARANVLSGDMSRAGNSFMNTGIFAVPAQFWTYQYRLFETFWGGANRLGDSLLTRMKNRAKLLLLNAALYGITGLAITGVPFGDIGRKLAIDHGYVMGKEWLQTLMYEGGLAFAGQVITSPKDREAGNVYNFSKKYGPPGLPLLSDLLYSDKTIWGILGGAALSKAAALWQSKDGYVNATMSMIRGDVGREAWPMTLDDWTEGLKQINSFNYAYRLGYAIEFGKWINKHEQVGANVSIANAIWMTLSGTDLQSMEDKFIKRTTLKEQDTNWKNARNEFTEYWIKANDAAKVNDPNAADIFMRKAYATLRMAHIPPERWGEASAFAAKGREDTIRINESYYTKFVPTDRQENARKAYEENLQIERKRGN